MDLGVVAQRLIVSHALDRVGDGLPIKKTPPVKVQLQAKALPGHVPEYFQLHGTHQVDADLAKRLVPAHAQLRILLLEHPQLLQHSERVRPGAGDAVGEQALEHRAEGAPLGPEAVSRAGDRQPGHGADRARGDGVDRLVLVARVQTDLVDLARDDEHIDNVEQALERAVANGVKNLVIQPTHLMHGAEYDELVEALKKYEDKFESVKIAEPLLGEVGAKGSDVNADKKAVAKAVVAAAVKQAGFKKLSDAQKKGVAFVLMGHGTSHAAKITYTQMQAQMKALGYKNVFIGTVEGEPEETSCENIIKTVSKAGYKTVILRPLMVVAGDHANNDMADPEDPESWFSMFKATAPP